MLETKLSNQTARTNLASAGGEKNVPQLETKPSASSRPINFFAYHGPPQPLSPSASRSAHLPHLVTLNTPLDLPLPRWRATSRRRSSSSSPVAASPSYFARLAIIIPSRCPCSPSLSGLSASAIQKHQDLELAHAGLMQEHQSVDFATTNTALRSGQVSVRESTVFKYQTHDLATSSKFTIANTCDKQTIQHACYKIPTAPCNIDEYPRCHLTRPNHI
jgi:hypothetical protein